MNCETVFQTNTFRRHDKIARDCNFYLIRYCKLKKSFICLPGGGVYACRGGGVYAQGGVCLAGEVSACRVVSAHRGGVHLPTLVRQTPVKTKPFRNYCCGW